MKNKLVCAFLGDYVKSDKKAESSGGALGHFSLLCLTDKPVKCLKVKTKYVAIFLSCARVTGSKLQVCTRDRK